jgi:hypothetical protein
LDLYRCCIDVVGQAMRDAVTGTPLSNQGFTVLSVLISLAILLILSFAGLCLWTGALGGLAQSGTLRMLEIQRRNFNSLILDPASWHNTVVANSGTGFGGKMDCLLNGTPCTQNGLMGGMPIQGQSFALLDAKGIVFFDATNQVNGLTRTGTSCTTFSDSGCVFSYDLKWTANCTVGNCVNPQIKINAALKLGSLKTLVINPANYSVPETLRSAF